MNIGIGFSGAVILQDYIVLRTMGTVATLMVCFNTCTLQACTRSCEEVMLIKVPKICVIRLNVRLPAVAGLLAAMLVLGDLDRLYEVAVSVCIWTSVVARETYGVHVELNWWCRS